MQNEDPNNNRDHFLRELLKNEFQRRLEKNPSFSLRALAFKLGIDQSLLSKLLHGKRKFTPETAKKVQDFLGLYTYDMPSDPSADYQLMKEDEFFVLSAWYHFAILELIKTKTFKHTSQYIAEKLGISDLESERAIERLTRLNFIEIEKNKYVIKKASNSWLNFQESSVARKELQKQMQEKSLQALEDVTFDKREHSSLTVAVDPKHIIEIKKKITEFRRSLDKYIMEQGNEVEVYNLNVSFFPLTKDLRE